MKHVTSIILAVVCVVAPSALAALHDFDPNTLTGPDYLWGTNDNWLPSGPTDEYSDATIGLDLGGVPIVETAVLQSAQESKNITVVGGSSLTIRAGAVLDLVQVDGWGVVMLGTNNDLGHLGPGRLYMEGGTINVLNTSGNHGPPFFLGRYDSGSLLEQTGGTINLQALTDTGATKGSMAIGAMSATGRNVYNMSGGALNAHYVLLPHDSATMGGEWNISGNAAVDLNGTDWNSGLMVEAGGTLTLQGGSISFTVEEGVRLGGPFGNDGTFTLAWAGGSTGISTVNAGFLEAGSGASQNNIVDLTTDGNLATDTYTLMHLEGNPGANFNNLVLTADPGFSSLQLVDVDGNGTSGWDIRVDYSGGPAFQLGDMDGSDGLVEPNGNDINPFVLALVNRPAYEAAFPGLDADARGDCAFPQDGLLNGNDINAFVALLVGGGSQAVPEPVSMVMLGLGACLALLRRRR